MFGGSAVAASLRHVLGDIHVGQREGNERVQLTAALHSALAQPKHNEQINILQ